MRHTLKDARFFSFFFVTPAPAFLYFDLLVVAAAALIFLDLCVSYPRKGPFVQQLPHLHSHTTHQRLSHAPTKSLCAGDAPPPSETSPKDARP